MLPLPVIPTRPIHPLRESNARLHLLCFPSSTLHCRNKPNPIRLTLPLGNKSSQPPPPPPPPTTTTTTPHRRKSSKVKRVPPSHELVGLPANPATVSIPFHEDNTNSIDDLPLGERTSPNKPLSNPIESNTFNPVLLTTPVKKKTSSNNKKKTSQKKVNNIVGVAVIEERRVCSTIIDKQRDGGIGFRSIMIHKRRSGFVPRVT